MIQHQSHPARPDRVNRSLPRRLVAGDFHAPYRRSDAALAGPVRRPLDR